MTISDLGDATWRKSSRSGATNDCVELAVGDRGAAVRDSKRPEAGHLVFTETGWLTFLGVIKAGRPDSC